MFMDTYEATMIVRQELMAYRRRPYVELRGLVDTSLPTLAIKGSQRPGSETATGRPCFYFLVIRRFVWIAIVAASACGQSPGEQLDRANPYARLRGTEYRIIGDVDAFGIYAWPEKKLAYVTLIPGA